MIEKTCDFCKNLILRKRIRTSRNGKPIKNFFCNKECRSNFYKNNIKGKCENCNKEITRKRSQFRSKNNIMFCSRKCSSIYNNNISNKIGLKNNCKDCGCEIAKSYKLCKNCKNKKQILKESQIITLKDLIYNRNDANKYNKIRGYARSLSRKQEQKCLICNYNQHVEVCHIKAISDFDLETPISIINSNENLVLLCPNCHWEFDHQRFCLLIEKPNATEESRTPNPLQDKNL